MSARTVPSRRSSGEAAGRTLGLTLGVKKPAMDGLERRPARNQREYPERRHLSRLPPESLLPPVVAHFRSVGMQAGRVILDDALGSGNRIDAAAPLALN